MTMRYNSGGVAPADKDNVDLQSDASGNLKVSAGATTGSAGAGTAAGSSTLVGGVYNTTVPAPTNGQQVALQLDSEGRLKVESISDYVFVDVTFVSDTSILASGDVITATAELTGVMRAVGGVAKLIAMTMFDQDDQGTAIDVILMRATQSLGTVNGAPTISDANALDIGGLVQIAAADFSDLGGVRVAHKTGLTTPIAAVGTDDLFASLICRSGTPTYTASGLKARFVFERG